VTPEAAVEHHIPGRTRFRVSSKRGAADYFAGLREQFPQCPGVVSVTTNHVTGSVLIIHDSAEPGVLVDYARTLGLFDVRDQARAGALERVRPPDEILTHRLEQLDQWVQTETRRETDLRSVALTGLIAAALWQLLRGPVFPAAATLFWYALSVARRPAHSGTQGRTSAANADETLDTPIE
jgi:hypothetical protein